MPKTKIKPSKHYKLLGIKIRKVSIKYYFMKFFYMVKEFLFLSLYTKFPISYSRKTFFYYTSNLNFGDILNFEIISKILKINIVKASIEKADYMFIGSLAQTLISDKAKYSNPIKVIGAGFIEEQTQEVENYIRPLSILCVRGKLTKERFEKNLNTSLENVVLADPGILAPLLLDESKIIKKYKVGIVPHFSDRFSPLLKELSNNIPGSKIINIQNCPIQVTQEIAECEIISASAMHALIVASALSIPNQWIKFSDLYGGEYKFKDFYSAFNIENPTAIDLRTSEITTQIIENIKKSYSFPMKMLKQKQLQIMNLLEKEFYQ